jgi:hypothetical protein
MLRFMLTGAIDVLALFVSETRFDRIVLSHILTGHLTRKTDHRLPLRSGAATVFGHCILHPVLAGPETAH